VQQQAAGALDDDGSEMDWEPGVSDDGDMAADGGRRKGQRRRQGYGCCAQPCHLALSIGDLHAKQVMMANL
jgi:hypothetical protein